MTGAIDRLTQIRKFLPNRLSKGKEEKLRIGKIVKQHAHRKAENERTYCAPQEQKEDKRERQTKRKWPNLYSGCRWHR